MHRPRLIQILTACLLGCNSSHPAHPPPQPPPATRTPQSVLKPIELRYSIYLARFDLHITVSPEGNLRSVRTDNKSHGPNDIDPSRELVEVREGKLTAQQVADLARLFTDWDSLPATPYGGVADGGEISIRHGRKTVSGGSDVPSQVTEARIHLMELARSMPLAKR